MQYGNIDALLERLREREKKEIETLLATAQQEYDSAYNTIVQEAKKRIEQRQAHFSKEIHTKRQRELTRLRLETERQQNAYKESLILEAMHRCKSNLHTLSEEAYVNFVKSCLDDAWLTQNIEEVPILLVPERYRECTQKALGEILSVRTDPEVTSGFIISFQDYSINQETEQLFAFYESDLRSALIEQCLC